MRQIIIPSSVKEIGQRAFYGCNLLTDVKIPSSVTSIGKFAFGYCSSLTEIEIPSSITVIKESTFNQCTKLNKITLPSSIESVEYDAFSGTISLTIVGSIKRIPPRCFHFNYTLKNVNLPFFLTSIGEMSFNNCASLKNITIHPFVTTIDDSAFNLCISLEEITLPSSLTSIGYHAFGSCQKLRKILIPSSVTSIGSLAFEKCISLDELYIPSSLTSISKSAFNGIKSIILYDDFKMIPNNCFAGCPTLERVSIPSSVTSFGDYCFSGCKSIREIFIPSCLTSIGKYAFMKCSSLEEISLPESIKNIDEGAFFGCEAIIQVKIPSSITSISNYCFSCCCNLKTITIPSSITSIGNNAFSCCSVLNYVCIPSVTSIGTCAFFKCLLLDKIVLSSSPIQIASDAFLGCISLNHPLIKNSEQMLDINDFRVQDELNENGYLFYLAIKNDNLYKIKTYNSFLFGKSIDFIQEVNISRIDIPEIIKVQKFYFPLIREEQAVLKSLDPFQSNCYITASEYLQYGNIFDIKEKYLKSKGTINTLMNPLIRNKIIFGVAATMKKLHKKNIIHRGLKLTSIYLDDNLEPKIDTFPFAKDATNSYELHNYADEFVFTAPELLMDKEHGFPVDVFSYAFVLYFLFTNDIGMRKHFAMSIFGLICKGSRPNRPDDIPDHYWELIQNCWKQNPDERPTFEDITNILRDDKYALEEFGMKTDLNLLHQYQQRIDPY